MILTDNAAAVEWLKRAYKDRGEKCYWQNEINTTCWNMYMTTDESATGLLLMQNLNMQNADLVEESGYRNLDDFLKFEKL